MTVDLQAHPAISNSDHFLDCKQAERDKIKGLTGADDYIPSHSARPNCARVNAVLRRAHMPLPSAQPCVWERRPGYQSATRTVMVRGQEVELTPTEHLARYSGQAAWATAEHRADLRCCLDIEADAMLTGVNGTSGVTARSSATHTILTLS
jgi:hypothetical protein